MTLRLHEGSTTVAAALADIDLAIKAWAVRLPDHAPIELPGVAVVLFDRLPVVLVIGATLLIAAWPSFNIVVAGISIASGLSVWV